MNLIEIFERFPTQDAAREYLVSIRWPDGVSCPKCGECNVSELKSRNQYTCLAKHCRYRFSVTSDTVMHSTKLDLRKWLCAICILVNAKKSVSSHQLARELNISVKRAWHLNHRIRTAMAEDSEQFTLFEGIVQADECYLGGKPRPEEKGRYKRGGACEKKVAVLGIYEKESGSVRTAVIANTKSKTIEDTIGRWINRDSTELHTDEHAGYLQVGRQCQPHRVVDHSDWYVTADGVHTNDIECAWSLLRRAMIGSFHHVSRKHLPRYLSEFDSRFSARNEDTTEYFERIISHGEGRRLTMNQLTGKDSSDDERTAS